MSRWVFVGMGILALAVACAPASETTPTTLPIRPPMATTPPTLTPASQPSVATPQPAIPTPTPSATQAPATPLAVATPTRAQTAVPQPTTPVPTLTAAPTPVAPLAVATPTPTAPAILPLPTPTPTSFPQTPAPTVGPGAGQTVRSAAESGLQLVLSLSRTEYRVGDAIEASLSLVTTTDRETTVTTTTSQLFDLIIRSPRGEQRWSQSMAFLQVLTTHRIPTVSGVSQVLTWRVPPEAKGEISLTGLTTPLILEGKRLQLQTPPITVIVQ